MKLYVILTIFLTLLAALSPLVVLTPAKGQTEAESTTVAVQTKKEEEAEEETAVKTIKVLRTGSGNIVEKDIFDYDRKSTRLNSSHS